MCGRYQLIRRPCELAGAFGCEVDAALRDAPPRFNIAPSQPAPIVREWRERQGERRMELVRWGLVPWWAKDVKRFSVIAEAETAATHPAFRDPMKRRRCLMPATGFYQWTQPKPGQPHLIQMADGEPFGIAALWEHWQDPAGNELETCCLLTTLANEMMAPIHPRMPVIIDPDDYDRWLDPDLQDPAAVTDLLRPFPAEQMVATPISTAINTARDNEGPGCVQPLMA